MNFGGFLGNESLKKRLSASISAGKLSHSYLLAGPEGSGKETLSRLLAAAMECTSEGEKPCLGCAQCRKVMSGAHPDVIIADDPEKKTVSVTVARWAKSDLYVRPNEGKRKIYIFPRAQELTPAAQNALLKVMEEPPEYGAFLLLADRSEGLLPTVRSRCVELTLAPVEQQQALPWLRQQFPQTAEAELLAAWRRSGGFLGQAKAILGNGEILDQRAAALIGAFAADDRLALAQTLCKMEKLKRDQVIPILQQTQALIAQALSAKNGIPATAEPAKQLAARKTAAALLGAYGDLRQAIESANANVGVGHICGFLAVRLRQQS